MAPHQVVSVAFRHRLRNCALAAFSDPLPSLPSVAVEPEVLPPPPEPEVDPAIEEVKQREQFERQSFDEAIVGLRAAAAVYEDRYQSMLLQMREAAVELAVSVAGRILLDRVQAGSLPLEPVIRHVVSRLPVRRGVTVQLHPDDLNLVQQRLGEQPLMAEAPGLQFLPDPSLPRGGCRAEAAEVTVSADLQWQLANLREHLLEGVVPCSD